MRRAKWPLTCTNILPSLWMKKKISVIPFTFRTSGCHKGSALRHPGADATAIAYPQLHPSYPPVGFTCV
jgi:hypothetical protein